MNLNKTKQSDKKLNLLSKVKENIIEDYSEISNSDSNDENENNGLSNNDSFCVSLNIYIYQLYRVKSESLL
jgi:hypothetical protein